MMAANIEVENRYDLIVEQVGLYHMSQQDITAPSAEDFMEAICNIVDYGHPAGEVDDGN